MSHSRRLAAGALVCLAFLPAAGCISPIAQPGTVLWAPDKHALEQEILAAPDPIPRELSKTEQPEYIIEIPDILLVDAVNIIPKPPYRISTLDVVGLTAQPALPDRAIDGNYPVQPGGVIDLGPPYGSVTISGMTIEQANQAVKDQLAHFIEGDIEVYLSLAQASGKQQIAGEHLVGIDGFITLGMYGKVHVNGLTQGQAKEAIETHLANYLEEPEVSVDVLSYNSKKYYVITQGAGLGDGVYPFPITGNETVLDAIAQINGLEAVSSKRIWVARPAPHTNGCDQLLPVDWVAITQRANTATNYQILPGDRVYVAQDNLIWLDTAISKITSPMERLFGVTLLGTNTVSRLRFFHRGPTGSGFGGF